MGMMKEIFQRGPIACGIVADPLLNYDVGIVTNMDDGVDHVISVVGWGTDAKVGKYWIVRNSWGEYWGEYGYVRVKFGALGLTECNWATVKDYTAPEKGNQFHCHEGGDNCKASRWSSNSLCVQKFDLRDSLGFSDHGASVYVASPCVPFRISVCPWCTKRTRVLFHRSLRAWHFNNEILLALGV